MSQRTNRKVYIEQWNNIKLGEGKMQEAKCKNCGAIFEFEGNFPTGMQCNCDSKNFDINKN